MGVVYKAEDTDLDRFVALKFLPDYVNVSTLSASQDWTRDQETGGMECWSPEIN